VQEGHFVSANSLGFMGGYPTSRHYLSCSVIAGEGETCSATTGTRLPAMPPIGPPELIGERAARRALARLGARKIKTCKVPVIFEAPLGGRLIGNFVHAVSGGSLYRKTSFLLDSLGKRSSADFMQISRAAASGAWPGEQPLRRRWRGHARPRSHC
jgi:PmbA protein